MAEKKPPKAKGPSLPGDLEKVVINQALVMAETFSRRFTPVSLEMPRCLMPFCNVPMIDYTIEMLASSGVQEIYIFACNHPKLIQDHVAKSHWLQLQGLKVHVLVSKQCSSIGEALREVKNKNIFTSDFVLIFGDVVSNLRIDTVLQAHRERRVKSKSAIMTMVLKKASPTHPTRSIEDDTVVAIDPATGELLAYENAPKSRKFKLPAALLAKSNVQMRYDLLDCHIDVCSPEVLQGFEDNPDYQDVRRDMIKGTLSDDVYNYRIYTHILSGEYAARAKDLRTYAATSKDLLHRWVYPITPDSNLLGHGSSYQHLRGPNYRERDVKLSIVECHIYPSTMIGGGSSVGSHSVVRSSVIGRNCTIGAHCRIEDAFIWDNVTIADNAVVISSVLASGVALGAGSKVEGGCVVSFNVVIGPNVRLEPHTRLTTFKPESLADFDGQDPTVSINLGVGGVGRKWTGVTKEELLTSLVFDSVRQTRDGDSDSEPDLDGEAPDTDDEDVEDAELADEKDYYAQLQKDVVETMLDSQGISTERQEDLARELKTKRTTYNEDLTLTVLDVGNCAVVGVLKIIIATLPPTPTAAQVQLAIINKLKHWSTLLKHFSISGKLPAEIGYLRKTKEFLATDEAKLLAPWPFVIFKGLYDCDLITEEAIESWKKEEETTELGKVFLQKCEKFFQYIEPEEEDEAEEDE